MTSELKLQVDEQERCRKWLKDRYDYIDSKKDSPGGTIGLYLGDSDLVCGSRSRIRLNHLRRLAQERS